MTARRVLNAQSVYVMGAKNGSMARPAVGGETITPNNNQDLPKVADGTYLSTQGIWVGGDAGDIAVVWLDGSEGVIPNVPTQTIVPVAVKRVKSTGTTATTLQAWY